MNFKTVLILSDLHYGDLAQLESFGKVKPSSDDELRNIAQSVVDVLASESISVDYIFVLGDLTSKGSPGELQDVNRFLAILRNLLSLNQDRVFITYGNHDIDWKVCSLAANSDEHSNAYCRAAATFGSIFAPPGNFTSHGPVAGSGIAHLEGIDLISLNSGIECYASQEIKHGKLGIDQFKWVEQELHKHLRPSSTKIVILHHHLITLPYSVPVYDLSALEEGANIVDTLGEYGIDLVLHGHRHHPIVHTTIKSNWRKPITFFCAGSFGVGASERASGRLPNTIHTVRIAPNSGAKNFEGLIQSFELSSASEWIPLEPKYTEYPLNQTQWFGSPGATSEAPQKIKEILFSAKTSVNDHGLAHLPEYNNLPLPLRCILHKDLSELFQSEASSMGLCVTGEYPSKCILTKS